MRVPSVEGNRPQRPVTQRQRRVLEAIADRVRARLPMPTLRELGSELGIKSTNGIADHLAALERKGMILRPDTPMSRYLKLTDRGLSVCRLPKPSDHQALKDEVIAASVVWAESTQSGRATTELLFAIRKLRAYEASL